MTQTMTPATSVRPAAIGKLTVNTRVIAANVAAHGGRTFQTNMFSAANTAFDVRGHPARQRAGQTLGEESRRMPGEMAEQIASQVASDFDKSGIGDPARQPP